MTTAVSGQTIDVAQGTYKPTTGTDRTATFNLLNGVAIYGGFAGDTTPNPGLRNFSAYPTILSGDIGVVGNNSDNSYSVVAANSVNSTAILDGFTITGGNANGPGNYNNGGGIFADAASPMINNCLFTANSAGYGGAIETTASANPTITNCIFNGNVGGVSDGGGGGGAIFNSSSSPTIINCAFLNNQSTNYGGAVNNANSSPTILNCTFSNNSAPLGEALVDYLASDPLVTNCIFWADTGGSEIYNFGGATDTITYSDVSGGSAGTGNINSNPLFVNAAAGNLQLQAGSPAIDSGNSAAVPSNITTDLAGNPRITGAAVDMGAYQTIFLPAPVLSTFTINDGNAQRSMIDSLTVTFNEPVTLAAGAITLDQVNYVAGTSTPQAFTLSNPSDDQQTYVLTFTGANYRGGSLSNGFYNLTVNAAMVTNVANEMLAGGNQTFLFYRLFGDFYGTGTVNFSDLLLVAQDYGAAEGTPQYLWYMDPDDSGVVNFPSLLFVAQDYGQTAQI